MTLVAGFKCRDGFVLAADTEIAYGVVRFQSHKLANFYGQGKSYDVVIGGAGDGVYIDATCQKIRDALANLASPSFANIKTEVETVISELHANSLFKYWEPDDPNRPGVQLICGVQDQQKEWGLLQTDKDAVAETDSHAVAGTGAELAQYMIERLWMPGLSAAVTVHIARQLFREVKSKGIHVGGNTEIVGRRVTKDAETFFDPLDEKNRDYRFLWGIDELVASGIRVALDITKPSMLLDQRIADITERLTLVRRDSEAPRPKQGDTVYITEFGSEYGDWYKDLS
jgi:20S proteasome alpha/beta subunit